MLHATVLYILTNRTEVIVRLKGFCITRKSPGYFLSTRMDFFKEFIKVLTNYAVTSFRTHSESYTHCFERGCIKLKHVHPLDATILAELINLVLRHIVVKELRIP